MWGLMKAKLTVITAYSVVSRVTTNITEFSEPQGKATEVFSASPGLHAGTPHSEEGHGGSEEGQEADTLPSQAWRAFIP